MRKEADERMRAEIEKAYQESGLHLDKDRREVFGLRYRQERRRLERDLQEKLEAERARRLPGVIDELKREFADRPPARHAGTVHDADAGFQADAVGIRPGGFASLNAARRGPS